MSWLILFMAGLLEITWAIGLKAHDGRPLLIALTAFAAVMSVVLLGAAVKNIPISTAYAVWTGIGIVGTVVLGVIWFEEPLTRSKCLWLLVTAVGILGLKLS